MSNQWPAPELDGWTYAHNTIRLDEEDILNSVGRLADIAATGEHVQDWEITALKAHWAVMHGFIDEHHHNEEEHIFPAIAERATIPDKMSDDHEVIESTVKHIDDLVKSLKFDRVAMHASSNSVKGMLSPTSVNVRSSKDRCTNLELCATLNALRVAIVELIQSMNPHLLEEEKAALPAMTSNFTPAEMKPVFDKMIGQMEWFALPHFYRQHKVKDAAGHPVWDRAAIRQHATGVLGMPGFVFDFIIFPTFKRYDSEYGWFIEELKEPSQRAWCEGQRRSRATWFRRTRKVFSAASGRTGTFSGKAAAAEGEGEGSFVLKRSQSEIKDSARGVEALRRANSSLPSTATLPSPSSSPLTSN